MNNVQLGPHAGKGGVWRLQVAAQKLKAKDVPLKPISDEVGYESEAALSRAFKRLFGLPPADWRRLHAVPPGLGMSDRKV